MAGTSLLTLIDDIATLLDDVSAMTKVATQKTASVLGDDLAVNAQQVSGVKPDRELPVVWAVAKGSFKNKCILVPAALAISVFVPMLIVPLLIIGGIYLCFEGFEKVWHYYTHRAEQKEHHNKLVEAISDESVDMVAFEKKKISGAIRTDFILSAEIIVISLGVVSDHPFATQVGVLVSIAILITIGVYGLVAGIVKLDDAGLYLNQKNNVFQKQVGAALLKIAPALMKFLSVFGTVAMFLVGGGIMTHNLHSLHHISEVVTETLAHLPILGSALEIIGPILVDAIIGLLVGVAAVLLFSVYQKLTASKGKY